MPGFTLSGTARAPVEEVWKLLLANCRTPRQNYGDLRAMIGREGNRLLADGDTAALRGVAGGVRAMLAVLGLDPFDPHWAGGSSGSLSAWARFLPCRRFFSCRSCSSFRSRARLALTASVSAAA